MTDTGELDYLISLAQAAGATVTVTYDEDLLQREGRRVHETIQVSNLQGIGPCAMSPISAAEALRPVARRALYGPQASLRNVLGR